MDVRNVEALVTSVGSEGYVSADDVLFLRRNVFADGIVSRSELEAVFALGERAPDGDREWPQFFEEVCADFFLNEEEPRGYFTSSEFTVVKSLVTRDGHKASLLELSVLVRLLEKAVSTPHELADFVADQFRLLIDQKQGGPAIGEQDTELLRRYLYASGGAGSIAITKDEAELLFDLQDLTANADNHPAWCDLFIKAIAAHLMQHVGYKPLPREEALRLHDWVKDQSVNPGGFFNRMFSGGLSSIRESYGRKSIVATRNEDDEIARAIAEQVTAREADWLADRIGRDGKLADTERALIAYMKELEAELPPKLQALVSNAA
ncbi:MAG: hypothetical protein AAFR21_08810 [Pseudomonadota bacterium]